MTALPDARPTSTILCSDADAAAGDDPHGTAAGFTRFLLIEHRRSFSSEAAADALRAIYGTDAEDVAALPGLRPFATRPVARPDTERSALRFVGASGPRGYLRGVSEPPSLRELTDWSYSATAGRTLADPLFAVCTNGSRDRCCALKGRDLAAQLLFALDGRDAGRDAGREADLDASVVEISHLGGHRFAPTMLVLPWGYSYGPLDLDTAIDIAEAAQDGLVHPARLRGRADLAPAGQAADAWWRTELGPAPIEAVRDVRVVTEGAAYLVTAMVSGRPEELRLTPVPGVTIAETACGGKPIRTMTWQRA